MDIEIAEKLQKYRKSFGYSQEELADILKVSRQAVSKWERAEASPDTDNLIALAKLYKISIDELIKNSSNIDDKNQNLKNEFEVKESFNQENNKESLKINENLSVKQNKEEATITSKQKLIKSFVGSLSSLISVTIYLLLGFLLELWHPTWIIFLLIPISTSIADAIIKKNAKHFAYPVLVVAIYLLINFTISELGYWNIWGWSWIIFLTIPIYYTILNFLTNYKND